MTGPDANNSRLTYRMLLRAYPRQFRERFGDEMEETFFTLLRWEGDRRGLLGKMSVWFLGGLDAVARGSMRRLGRGPRHYGEKWPDQNTIQPSGVWEMLGTILGDIRFAVRTLIRKPLFAVTVILTLAVGIGANTSVFTLVDGLLFTPLPYEEPEELVSLFEENQTRGWSRVNVSPLNAQDWLERSRALEDVAVYYNHDFSLTGEGPPELLSGIRVESNLLGLLGSTPALGRGFTDEEMGAGRDGVVILTDGFWQRHFAGDPGALGSTIVLEGVPRVVVGIMPQAFRFLEDNPDVFLPLDLIPSEHPRREYYLEAIGRLAPGVSLDEARTELGQIAIQLGEEYPADNAGWTVQIFSLHEEMLGPGAKSASLLLMVAVVFILIMVCVNVANLLLARGEHRTRELAVRMALGAGRGRVVRQLLTESLVLGTLGGALGLLLANWGYRGGGVGSPHAYFTQLPVRPGWVGSDLCPCHNSRFCAPVRLTPGAERQPVSDRGPEGRGAGRQICCFRPFRKRSGSTSDSHRPDPAGGWRPPHEEYNRDETPGAGVRTRERPHRSPHSTGCRVS
ncbi:ABC transporter permease [Gemmatimonadota bacterium]